MKLGPAGFALAGVVAFGAGDAVIEGNPNSAVRVIIYEDLQCPDCATFRVMLDKQILPKFGAKVAFEHRDFPLPRHKWARPAVVASRFFASIRPDLAVEWRRYTLGHIDAITPDDFEERLSGFAREHGVDPAKALAALRDKQFELAVQADYEEGIARTPTVFVADEPFIETFTFEEIAASLAKAVRGQ